MSCRLSSPGHICIDLIECVCEGRRQGQRGGGGREGGSGRYQY